MVASFVLIMLAMNVQLNLVAAMVVEDATEDRDHVTVEDPDQDHATVDVHDPNPANANDQVVGEDDVDRAAMIDPDRDQTEEAVTTNLDHDRSPDPARRADPDRRRDEISVISQPKGEYHVTFPFAIFLSFLSNELAPPNNIFTPTTSQNILGCSPSKNPNRN